MKTKSFKNCLFLLIGILLMSGCHHDSKNQSGGNEQQAENQFHGKTYDVKMPENIKGIKCQLASEEQVGKLTAQGHQFITTPIDVTAKDSDTVMFDQMVTVSFTIPEDYPKENYYRLMGVIITNEGPVYMIPDPEGIEKGLVMFETNHFCPAGAVDLDDRTRREQFIKRTAANGWQNDLCNADLEKSLKEKLMETAESIGLGENDFLGIAAREVLADNDFVKDAMSLIDGKEPAELIAEKLEAEVKNRTLGYLFGKLQKNPNNMKLKKFLETHLTVNNAESWATQLGEGKNPMSVAFQYAHGFAVKRLKDFSTTVCPYVKTVQATAKAMEIIKKFWSSNKMNEMFERYKKFARPDGTMDDDTWNLIIDVRELAAAKSKFGMTSREIREMFENRIKNDKDIKKKEREIEKTVLLWENNYWLLQSKAFKHLDYVQRLTVIHNLMERFRRELVRNGDIPHRRAGVSVDELLCEIVEKYLEFYPDQQAFYEWLTQMGYYENKFQRGMDALDKERSWWLVRTDIISKDNENGEHTTIYSASENEHTRSSSWSGEGFNDYNTNVWYGPYNITFVATCDTPPASMNPGDTIVLHASISVSGGETGWYIREGSSLNFDDEGVGMGGIRYINRGEPVNLTGSRDVGSRYGEAKNGSWDYIMKVPSGRKDELRAINFDACGSRTHWVYKWATIFELEDD